VWFGGRLVQWLDGVDGRLGGPEVKTSGPSGHFVGPDVARTLATGAYLPLMRQLGG